MDSTETSWKVLVRIEKILIVSLCSETREFGKL